MGSSLTRPIVKCSTFYKPQVWACNLPLYLSNASSKPIRSFTGNIHPATGVVEVVITLTAAYHGRSSQYCYCKLYYSTSSFLNLYKNVVQYNHFVLNQRINLKIFTLHLISVYDNIT
jgi:hypothetical protein